MAEMTQRIKDLFERVPAVVLSTVSMDGTPNAVPVGSKRIISDNTLLFSNQFLNKTLANMKDNPKVAVTFWEKQEGYQLKGRVSIKTTGKLYEDTVKWIEDLGNKIGFPLESKGAILFSIEEIYGVSPGPGAGKRLA
ncbi:MAG: pyridoxamine 5'-phosphate oxidase family protein [Desulfatiglandaceae bacterium]